jgi:hypothetical protein
MDAQNRIWLIEGREAPMNRNEPGVEKRQLDEYVDRLVSKHRQYFAEWREGRFGKAEVKEVATTASRGKKKRDEKLK